MAPRSIPSEIDAVVFDFGFTLARLVPSRESLCQEVLHSLGLEHTQQEIALAYYLVDSQLKQNASRMALMEDKTRFFNEYNARLAFALRITSAQAAFNKAMQETFNRNRNWVVYEDAIPALKALRDKSKKLFILANWDDQLRRICDENQVSDYFDGIFCSQQIGAEKPEPRIFEAFLKQTEIDPKRALFVGDDYYADILGSRSFGFFPVLINRGERDIHADCMVVKSLSEIAE